MQKLVLIISLIVVGFLQARPLPPQESATLRTHMLEVNAEWSHMAPDAAWLNAEIAFVDERARIQTHLNLVVNTLKQRNALGTSTEAFAQRTQLLNKLQAYAQRGLFPENIHHDTRIPYFIDHKETACAVGFLMIQSGAQSVAMRVRDEMNQAYLRKIPYEEVPLWADTHGFSLDELAWIQPGYPPQTNYAGLDNGVNGTVTALTVDPADNSLVLAGSFTDASGVACKGVARWNGTGYEALGGGVNGEVHSLAFHNGKLYAGGLYNTPILQNMNIAVWDGQSWNYETASVSGAVRALLFHNGDLHAGTENGMVARLNEGSWTPVATALDGPVYTLTNYAGDLIAGGDFTSYVTRLNTQNSTWEALSGTAMDNTVWDLKEHKGKLYAGGALYQQDSTKSMGFAVYASTGWEMAFDTANDYRAQNMYLWNRVIEEPAPMIRSLHSYQGGLFLGGQFLVAGGIVGIGGSGLGWARNDAGTLVLEPVLALFGDTVITMTTYNNNLILGGDFNYFGQVDAGGVYETNLQGLNNFVSNDPSIPQLDIHIGPQPWASEAKIKGLPSDGYELYLFDLQGKEIPLRYTTRGAEATLYRDGQASGIYTLRVSQRGRQLGVTKVVLR